MNWETIVTTIGSFLAVLGGWEGIKYLLNRRANSRHAEAQADEAEAHADEVEVKVEHDRWKLFDDMIKTLQEGLITKDKAIVEKDRIIADKDRIIAEKDAQYLEQTQRLRTTQDNFNTTLKELVEVKAKYIYADTWRCEEGKCRKRKPPKPQLYGLEYNEDLMPIVTNDCTDNGDKENKLQE